MDERAASLQKAFPDSEPVAAFVVNGGEPSGVSGLGGDDFITAAFALFELALGLGDWILRRRHLVVVTADGLAVGRFRRFSTRRIGRWTTPPTPGLGYTVTDDGPPARLEVDGEPYWAKGRHRDVAVRHARPG